MTQDLPRIACFHGGGSRAAIHEIQCSFLTQLLAKEFQFEFFEGPFDTKPGPGILPAFAGYGTYKSWFSKDEAGADRPDGSGYDQIGRDGVERVWRMMEARRGGRGGEWVGVMGFSQGTRVAGGLLLDQQRRADLGLPPASSSIRLKFGVMCMGGGAPMESEVGHKMPETETRIRIPTLHMHGLKDEFLSLGQHQYNTFYDPASTMLYEINYHHAMPWVKDESEELAVKFRKLYESVR